MPIHDWSRVSAGTFHAFHNAWITHLQEALNAGILPPGFYALGEQAAGETGPDALTLEASTDRRDRTVSEDRLDGTVAVAEHPPQVQWSAESELAFYVERQRSLVIRHASDDRVVALLEILSPANKASRTNLETFLDKVVSALQQGCHLLLIDLHSPRTHDPNGIHGAVWEALGEEAYHAPHDAPLTLAAYSASEVTRAYVEPTAVGRPLKEMPLFLTPGRYVNTPLEPTYMAAWRGMPQRWRDVIEGR